MVDKATNTGDLKVRLYFDENNFIKTEIIFDEDKTNISSTENNKIINNYVFTINYDSFFTENNYKTDNFEKTSVEYYDKNYETFDFFKYNLHNFTSYKQNEAFNNYIKELRQKTSKCDYFYNDEDTVYNQVFKEIYKNSNKNIPGFLFVIGHTENEETIQNFNFESFEKKIVILDYDIIDGKNRESDYENIKNIRAFWISSCYFTTFYNSIFSEKYTWKMSLYKTMKDNFLDVVTL